MSKKIFTAIAIFIAAIAHAQKDTSTQTLDAVIVTANKYPQKQSTTGKVISVITKEQIERSSGKSVAEILNEQAGVTINGAYNNPGSVQTLFMRGASSGRTLVLMDGIPLNDPSMINNEFDLNLFSLSQVEQIEICRGAQSTLYGSDAIAGVVNIITVKPNVSKAFNIKTTHSFGSLNTYKGNVQVYGEKDKITYSARYAKLYSGGFSSVKDTSLLYGLDDDKYDGNVANAQLNYQFTPQLSFRTYLLYSQYKSDIDAGGFNGDRDYVINNDNLSSGVGFVFNKDFVRVAGNYQYNQNNRKYFNDTLELNYSRKKGNYEDNKYFGKTQFAELYASINLGSGFTLLQGGDYRYSAYNQDLLVVSSFGPFRSKFKDTSLNQAALYASLNFRGQDDRLYIELGGRLNTHSRYGANNTYTFNPAYKINQHFRVFGSLSTGFKAPTLYQLSLNKNLKPEKSENIEVGAQWQNSKANIRITGFKRNIENGIDYNYISFSYFNYIKQKVKGVETELSYQPTKTITFTGNYTYLSAKEITQNRVTVKDTITYSYLLRRPTHTVNASISYLPTEKLYFSLSAKYVSDRFDVGGYKLQDVKLNSYVMANFYAEFKANTSFKFFINASNILNKKFYDINGYNATPAIVNAGFSFSK